jgi:hypothetical protein
MGQKAMIAEPDTPAAGDPLHDEASDQIFPAKKEQRYDSENVKYGYE